MEHVPRVFTALQQARDSVKAVQEAYDQGPYVGVADQALKGLAALEPADADAVAVAIVDIVNAPFGKRSYRVFVDPSQDGAEETFLVGDRMRREMFQNIGLKDLLGPIRQSLKRHHGARHALLAPGSANSIGVLR